MSSFTNINKIDLNGTYSYADYLTWNFKERLELFRGKIFKMSPAPNRVHQTISAKLHLQFANSFKKNTCNVYYAPFDVRLVKSKTEDEKVTTVVQPDLCIICDDDKLDDRGCIGAPDLVVEILSPGNTKKEMGIKFDLYEENEVKEYWLIDPSEKTVLIYTLQQKKYIGLKPFIIEDVLQSPLFPSLKFKVKDIFSGK
jgi:Uma2 family endonuclease